MKTKVDEFNGKDIFFDTSTEGFSCGDLRYDSLHGLRRVLEIDSKQEFTGNFYIKSYSGICKFVARKRFYSENADAWSIRGQETDKFASVRDETVEETELFPDNEINRALYAEGQKMIDDGWALIRKGESFKDKLVK